MISNDQRIKEWRTKANGGDPSSPLQPPVSPNKRPVLFFGGVRLNTRDRLWYAVDLNGKELFGPFGTIHEAHERSASKMHKPTVPMTKTEEAAYRDLLKRRQSA